MVLRLQVSPVKKSKGRQIVGFMRIHKHTNTPSITVGATLNVANPARGELMERIFLVEWRDKGARRPKRCHVLTPISLNREVRLSQMVGVLVCSLEWYPYLQSDNYHSRIDRPLPWPGLLRSGSPSSGP